MCLCLPNEANHLAYLGVPRRTTPPTGLGKLQATPTYSLELLSLTTTSFNQRSVIPVYDSTNSCQHGQLNYTYA